jgi:hypothetical protein
MLRYEHQCHTNCQHRIRPAGTIPGIIAQSTDQTPPRWVHLDAVLILGLV